MKFAIILGTRPEIIKMSPIIRICEKRDDIDFFILHTGQHYSYEMDKSFFEDLELPEVKYNLDVGGEEYRKQVGLMIREMIQILDKENPDVSIVQGDTNTVLAGALASNKLGIPVAHHEAGLRSHDLTMLEETNRIITDHISDYLFVPTEDALKNLQTEGMAEDKVFKSGNTVVDALNQNFELSNKKVNILEKMGLEKNRYILVTAHRAENVDVEGRLRGILDGLGQVHKSLNLPIIYPIHPRTVKNVDKFGLKFPDGVKLLKPAGYLEFLQLEANAALIITDSGGLQEEGCILKVPCVTVRDNTERPETVVAKVNILAGTDSKKIVKYAEKMIKIDRNVVDWTNPFGDGHAAEKIIDILFEKLRKIAKKSSLNLK